ncbi:hypothetical protein NLJ89_g9518 [Agrocybe chaxingu]|uniref:Uncharacterized protein n=1 Tax=Agrocybe chaxingu TaxID=84603 RepID=A0A9W8JQM7_9AGAR|nr:hypothetical protein NLJ89_g9518 [Agrocybe chaxingu]
MPQVIVSPHADSMAVSTFIDTVSRLPLHPDSSHQFQQCLELALDFERSLRLRYATQTIDDPYAGLIDIFATPLAFRHARPRVVQAEEELSARYLMPLAPSARRPSGGPCVVEDIGKFIDNWLLFSHGVLKSLTNWNNVVVAGGSVLASLIPLQATSTKDKIKAYHSETAMYDSSDIDIFLWGLTPAEAETRIKEIDSAVRESVPWDIVCVRKANTISFHTQYPFRTVRSRPRHL